MVFRRSGDCLYFALFYRLFFNQRAKHSGLKILLLRMSCQLTMGIGVI